MIRGVKNRSGRSQKKGLNEITSIQRVRFRYLDNDTKELQCDIEVIGFVTKEVQKFFSKAVSKAEFDNLDFNIHTINIALLNAA